MPTKTTDAVPSTGGALHRTGRSAVLVAIGILCSRLAGLVRQRAFAHYFGLHSEAADAFSASFRIPNLLQNLFGEGALSASFIPVYASLRARGEHRTADRVAAAVAGLLALIVSAIVLCGVLATPLLIAVVAPGFTGETRLLTIQIVRILFPGAGLLVMSAWCLGVLNSHGRFLLSYAAPVMWNASMIAVLLWLGAATDLPHLAVALAWGSVVGSALQFGVQVPFVVGAAPGLMRHDGQTRGAAAAHVATIARNFVPVFISRGVVQISAYIDTVLASLLPIGAVTGLTNAQLLYTLPVSLFGMSVSAAELPAMSGEIGLDSSGAVVVRRRLDTGLRRIAFFVIPSAMAFLALGDVIAGALLQTGRFTRADALYVWGILAGSAVGLLASTLGRLYSSTFYALRDTRAPLKYAVVRVVMTTILGYLCAVPLPGWIGISRAWGAAGLTASAGIAGWVEMLMLRRTLNRRIGPTGLPADVAAKLWIAAAAAAAAAWTIRIQVPAEGPIVAAVLTLIPYCAVFAVAAVAMGIPEASDAFRRVRAVFQRGRPGGLRG